MLAPRRLISAVACSALLIAGCGGVPRNPTEPQFPGRPGNQTNPQGTPTGGAGGAVAPDQDPNLVGATSVEDFRLRAHAALLQGNLVTGANGYIKMVELENTNAEAAFGLAVTTLLRDVDQWAGFTANELPLTFFNTPLALSPTLVPQPLAAEDSYFWRLLSLGVDSQPPMNPAAEAAQFIAEAGGAAPPTTPTPQNPATPTEGAGAASGKLRPSTLQPGGKAGGETERQPEGTRDGSNDGSKDVNTDSMANAPMRGGQSLMLPGTGRALPAQNAERTFQPISTGAGEPDRSGQQRVSGPAGNIPVKSGDGGTATAGGTERAGGAQPTGQQPTGSAPATDPAQILANAQYQKFETDMPGSELVPSAQRYLSQRAGLWFTWSGRNGRINKLRASLDTLITALDRAKDDAEGDFQVTLPVMLGAEKRPYEVTFLQEDYDVLMQTLKLYQWMIDYRGMYTTAGNWNFLVPLKDTDSDGVLTPAEYYPAAPFGTLTEAAKEENLKPLQTKLGTILRDLADAQKAYKESSGYETTEKNFIVPRNIENRLDSLLLDESKRILGVSIALPTAGGKVNLDYTNPNSEITVQYKPLFDGTLEDVRVLLRPVSADTHVVQATSAPEGGGEATGNVLPASLSWEALLARNVDVQGIILKMAQPVAKATVAVGPKTAETAEGTGMFNLADLQINPLVGQTMTVSGGGLSEPLELTVRSNTVVWDVSLPLQHAAVGAGAEVETPPVSGATTVGPAGETQTGPPTGRGMLELAKEAAGGDDAAPEEAPIEGTDEDADPAEEEAAEEEEATEAEGGEGTETEDESGGTTEDEGADDSATDS